MLLHCLSWICRRPWRVGLFVSSLVLFASQLPGRQCPAPGCGSEAPAPQIVMAAPAPPAASPTPAAEIGLQEALDRLGYTVNVPTRHNGRPLVLSTGYRTSTRSDAMDAERFASNGILTCRMLGQQAMLGNTTTFGLITRNCTGCQNVPLLRPSAETDGFWLSRYNGASLGRELPGDDLRFFIEETSGALGMGVLSSRAADNTKSGGASHVLVLPALSGGTWVDEGGNAGHWAGNRQSDGYLLCWEDASFHPDYQDMIVLVQGVRPLPQ